MQEFYSEAKAERAIIYVSWFTWLVRSTATFYTILEIKICALLLNLTLLYCDTFGVTLQCRQTVVSRWMPLLVPPLFVVVDSRAHKEPRTSFPETELGSYYSSHWDNSVFTSSLSSLPTLKKHSRCAAHFPWSPSLTLSTIQTKFS